MISNIRILEFRQSKEDVWKLLESTLIDLKAINYDEFMLSNKARNLQGGQSFNLEESIEFIKASVLLDYDNNLIEEPNEPWKFSYVIEVYDEVEINILTQLSSKSGDSQGSVYYGISMIRIENNNFVIWSSYDYIP